MKSLEEARIKIDNIDSKIIELYEERMKTILDVIKFKIENNIPIVDSNREVKMLEKNLSLIKNEDFKKYYKNVLDGFLRASKEMQQNILNKKL